MPLHETPRLLFVHAHPDDETLFNGVTIAHYAARGADVRVVTCTLGEEGEVIGDRWAQLTVDQADQLGGYRITELTYALQALGVKEPIYLGGPGRWRDSGMPGTPHRHRTKFVDADMTEAVAALAALIEEMRPHVVITYDPTGGYGHPDHVRTHDVTTAAVTQASSGSWQVPKFYWGVFAKSSFRAGLDGLNAGDVLPDWSMLPSDAALGFDDDKITAVIDAPECLPRKAAAMAAHATQITLGPTGRAFALSNKLALPVLGREHYVQVSGKAAPTGEHGWETDLLAGLDVWPPG